MKQSEPVKVTSECRCCALSSELYNLYDPWFSTNVCYFKLPYQLQHTADSYYWKVYSGDSLQSTDYVMHIFLKHTVLPNYFDHRHLPRALHAQVKEELHWITALGFMEPISSSQWTTSLTVIKKPMGKLQKWQKADFRVLDGSTQKFYLKYR